MPVDRIRGSSAETINITHILTHLHAPGVTHAQAHKLTHRHERKHWATVQIKDYMVKKVKKKEVGLFMRYLNT